MRLLETSSLDFVEFSDANLPLYAILSHKWGRQEVNYQDMVTLKVSNDQRLHDQIRSRAGYSKIEKFCAKAEADNFRFAWIDTCCIDKRDNTELSEAINSMYRWYHNATVCYAYLDDVPHSPMVVNGTSSRGDALGLFKRSKWFTRGWTLQELLAPGIVEFYAADWGEIGTKISLSNIISQVTGIDELVLRGADPSAYSVADRMSWAASRETTKPEDRAYSLLGIFQVNMPLLYGEGQHAFTRLQEEILRRNEDYTIIAWGAAGLYRPDLLTSSDAEAQLGLGTGATAEDLACPYVLKPCAPLATSIDNFSVSRSQNAICCLRVVQWQESFPQVDLVDDSPPLVTSRGLRISLSLLQISDELYIAYTNCAVRQAMVCIILKCLDSKRRIFQRQTRQAGDYVFVPSLELGTFILTTIYLANVPQSTPRVITNKLSPKSRRLFFDNRTERLGNITCSWLTRRVNIFHPDNLCVEFHPLSKGQVPEPVGLDEFSKEFIWCALNGMEPFVIVMNSKSPQIFLPQDPEMRDFRYVHDTDYWNWEIFETMRWNLEAGILMNGSNETEEDRHRRDYDGIVIDVAYRERGDGSAVYVNIWPRTSSNVLGTPERLSMQIATVESLRRVSIRVDEDAAESSGH